MFTVVWVRSALDELATLWNAAESSDRTAITSAANRIDNLLSKNPYEQGESRPKGRRILIDLPLVVIYEIREQDRMVRVLQSRLAKKRR
jgi:hypothetical protein